jgi:hypothetical protein
MGREYSKRPFFSPAGDAVRVTSLTVGNAFVTLKTGLNLLAYASSGVAGDIILPEPSFIGQEVMAVLNNGTTSLEANVNTWATASVFYGTTFNTAAPATTGADPPSIHFIANSTSQWAILSMGSTAMWTLSATTGSTGGS